MVAAANRAIWPAPPRRGATRVATPARHAAPAGHNSQPDPVISSMARKIAPIASQTHSGWAEKKALTASMASRRPPAEPPGGGAPAARPAPARSGARR